MRNTIKGHLKKNGMIIDCEVGLHRCGEVAVVFYNPEDGQDDETVFDVMYPLTKSGEEELASLFKTFCRENNIPANTVEEIHLNCVAESMEALAKIC